MKAHKFRAVRTAVAASGAALLMVVAGCGGSDDAGQDQDATPEQSADQSTEASEDDSADDGDAGPKAGLSDDGAATDTEESDSDEPGLDKDESEDTSTDDESNSEDSASDDAFDPCDILTPEDVSSIVGFDVSEPETQDIAGGSVCTFPPAGSEMQTAMVQWMPDAGSLDLMVDAAQGMFDDASDPEEVSVEGASDGLAFDGEYMSVSASAVYASVDGGMTQVIVAGDDADVDSAIDLTELTLSKRD